MRSARERAWARVVAARARQSGADFELHDDVRVWRPGSTPTFHDDAVQPLYGVVTGVADDSLEIRLIDGSQISVSPTVVELL